MADWIIGARILDDNGDIFIVDAEGLGYSMTSDLIDSPNGRFNEECEGQALLDVTHFVSGDVSHFGSLPQVQLSEDDLSSLLPVVVVEDDGSVKLSNLDTCSYTANNYLGRSLARVAAMMAWAHRGYDITSSLAYE